jgi:hypothetical protein
MALWLQQFQVLQPGPSHRVDLVHLAVQSARLGPDCPASLVHPAGLAPLECPLDQPVLAHPTPPLAQLVPEALRDLQGLARPVRRGRQPVQCRLEALAVRQALVRLAVPVRLQGPVRLEAPVRQPGRSLQRRLVRLAGPRHQVDLVRLAGRVLQGHPALQVVPVRPEAPVLLEALADLVNLEAPSRR